MIFFFVIHKNVHLKYHWFLWQCKNALSFNSLTVQTTFPSPVTFKKKTVSTVRIFHFYFFF